MHGGYMLTSFTHPVLYVTVLVRYPVNVDLILRGQRSLWSPPLLYQCRLTSDPSVWDQHPQGSGPITWEGRTLSRVVTLPENLQQVGKADLVGVEDGSDHLRVSCHACNIQHLWVLLCPPAVGLSVNPAAATELVWAAERRDQNIFLFSFSFNRESKHPSSVSKQSAAGLSNERDPFLHLHVSLCDLFLF